MPPIPSNKKPIRNGNNNQPSSSRRRGGGVVGRKSPSFDSSAPFTNSAKENMENINAFDFYDENVHSNDVKWGWDASNNGNDDGFKRNISSPSSLNSFSHPRKAKSTIQSTGGDDDIRNNYFNDKDNGISNSNYQNGRTKSFQELPNPTKVIGQVPFRNRFASAAMVSMRLNNNKGDEEEPTEFFQMTTKEDPQIPTQLFFNNPSTNKDSNRLDSTNNTDWPITIDDEIAPTFFSKSHEWPISPAEDSFESFGNHSVFSDITGSEITSLPSPSRDIRKKNSLASRNLVVSSSVFRKPTNEMLLDIEEEEDFDKHEMNKTASTHLCSFSDGEEEKPVNVSTKSSDKGDGNGSDNKGKKQSRLASLFASRSLNNNSHNSDGKRRSKSAPKPRSELNNSNNNEFSPVRSNASGASSGYVGWPGTVGKDGSTVPFSSSFSDDGFKPISLEPESNIQTKGEEIGQQKHHVRSHSAQTPQKKEFSLSKPDTQKGIGLKFFERKQSQSAEKKSNGDNFRVMELKRRFEVDIVDLDATPSMDEDDESNRVVSKNPADIYLAKVVNRVQTKSPSQCSSTINKQEQQNMNESYRGVKSSSVSNVDELINRRKGSSFHQHGKIKEKSSIDVAEIYQGENNKNNDPETPSAPLIDVSASLRRVRSALSPETLGSIPEGEDCFRLSEEALRKNERLSPIRSNASGANVKGFLGFLNKTQDVPNLMDDESDSCTSASTRGTDRHLIKRTEIGNWKSPEPRSVGFGGIANSATGHSFIHHGKKILNTVTPSTKTQNEQKVVSPPTDSEEEMNVVKVNSSLTTIQATMNGFKNRTTSAEFDANLTESDTDFFSSCDDKGLHNKKNDIGPSWPQRLTPLRQTSNSPTSDTESEASDCSSSHLSIPYHNHVSTYNLSMYAIDPSKVRKLVKRYRTLSNSDGHFSTTEDSKKAFALFEMRSRIMATDIERGIDRRGWTKVVDDIVLTSYYQASHRLRDAVVVSKAWREGASPSDARTAFFLTTGIAGSYRIKRQLQYHTTNGNSRHDFSMFDSNYGGMNFSNSPNYVWEKVLWSDDTDFLLLRCPSLEVGTLRGFDIFTEGDCQSILLKLTNDYCEELRTRLRDATNRQLIAEHIMKEEAEGSYDALTEAEDAYLEAMEQVNTIRKRLSYAEKAFDMTRAKIEALVSKYEDMLKGGDNDSNCGDDDLSDGSSLDFKAKEKLKRRAQRAELRAEVASREAEMAKIEAEKSKQEVERLRIQKEKELTALQQRLDDLEAKSTLMESFDGNFQKHAAFSALNNSFEKTAEARTSLLYAASTIGTDQDKNEAKERLKAKFRQRSRSINRVQNEDTNEQSNRDVVEENKLSGTVQQRLQFYARSLQAVEKK